MNDYLNPERRPGSPVPLDEHFVALGFQPFTAFGQFGEGAFDLRVLFQDVWWVDRHGNSELLAELDRIQLLLLLDRLATGASSYYEATMVMLVRCLGTAFELSDGGAKRAFRQALADMIKWKSPTEWIAGTPLARRIAGLMLTAKP